MKTKVKTIPVDFAAREQEHRLKSRVRDLEHELDAALRQREQDADYEAFVRDALHARIRIPEWTRLRRTVKRHEVMPVALFSDAHFDEVVKPEEVAYRNAYDRRIASLRLRNFFEHTIKIARDYVKGFHYPGIVVPFLGDVFSGDIHEELEQTNADTLISSLVHWIEPVGAGLRLLAAEFGRVHVPVVVGNHGRKTKKPIAKRRVKTNFDWLFAKMLERELANQGETRVTFTIPESQKLVFPIYDTKFLLSHGDEARGGSGIAGMLSPQLIAMARMKKTFDFDTWLLGHWHYRAAYRGIRVNGSLKGYDEYSLVSNFDLQTPQQDLFFVAPERGVMSDWPVFVEDAREGWRKG